MIIKFENEFGEQREIGKAATREEANKIIHQFLKEHKYKSYYWRYAYHPNFIWIDVGSWSEFFYIYPETEEEKELLKVGWDKKEDGIIKNY